MTIFFDQYYNTGIGDTPLAYGGEELGFFDAMSQAYDSQVRGSNIDTYVELMTEELAPLIDAIKEREDIKFINPGLYFGMSDTPGHNDRMREYRLDQLFEHLDENRELYPEFADLSRESLEERIKSQALEAITAGQEARERETVMGKVGGFVGTAGGVFSDDAFLEQLFMMGPAAFARTGTTSLGRQMLTEGVIGAGTEAMLQAGVMQWYQSLGLDYTYEQFFTNVAAGGILGSAFPVALRGGVTGVKLTADQVKRGIEAFRGNGIRAADADIITDQLDDLAQINSPDAPDVFTPPEGADADILKLVDDLNRNVDEATLLNNDAIRKADAALNSIPETVKAPEYGSIKYDLERQFTNNKTGETFTGYTTAVQRLYNDAKVLGYLDDGLPIPDAPSQFNKRAVVILGPPAAGKSTIANPIARRYGAAIIDPDEAKKILPEFNDGVGASAVHEESGYLAEIVMAKALEDGVNMVIPKVGGKPDSIRRIIQKLKNNGYEVDLVGMDVNFTNARNRMFMRFANTGRYIPHEYIKSIGDGPMQTYRTLKEEGVADGYTHIDNNGRVEDPKPVIEDTRNLLEGVDLRLRGGRPEDSGVRGQPRGTSADEADTLAVEQFIARMNKADDASANLDRGNLPDDPVGSTQTRPAPQETAIQAKDVDDGVEQVARDTDFDNMPDDEVLFFDEIIDDQVVTREMNGKSVKAELAQDQQMLDRLRGCVV